MKKAVACIMALLCALSFVMIAYSAKIDGIDGGYEWDGATSYIFIDGESNCGVKLGIMKIKFDNENRAIFFCFMLSDPHLEPDNLQTGISLTIENSSSFVLTMSENPNSFDINKYSFEGAMSVDDNNGATCEVRLGIKEGLPKTINGSVRYIDSEGIPSNEYKFSVVNEGYVELTALEVSPTADSDDPAYNPGLLTEKAKTTKKSTTKSTTTRKNRYTKATTTTVKYTTEKFVINTSPPYSYVRTTVPSTTKKSETTTAEKTTKSAKTQAGVTVYYYEKEIIISQVIITDPIEETTAAPETFTEAETPTTAISLSTGKKYKYIIGISATVLFLLLAAWAAIGAKKSNEGIEKSEKSDD